ncbi:retropepsin-like aspartic protease [Actinoplanes sp. Pm04-4]|uniref:Retropepsin-like aspartic protease n=1 Tax=Paractinoplanes pyxinae TaxID=2997416 RepID=A0ABT4B764_9ACTN|nr:retropepsin-like aspartic protease [Actinoplanes pyxinae]MCY1142358.1 retropepsin-like aspartic protease [Actinoplanes pyxinae]
MTTTFDRFHHLVRVPVRVGGDEYRFLIDTGIGITVVSSEVAGRADVRATVETMSGRRMSGQEVHAPLVRLPSLSLGEHRVEGHLAGVADLGDGFAGILGPDFYAGLALCVDPAAMTVDFVDPGAAQGWEVPLQVRHENRTVDAFVTLTLPSGREVSVEVDTGSDNLILDTRFAGDCGIDLDGPEVTTKTGTDETGYEWTRHWATVRGSVHLAAAPDTAQAGARVHFQEIIYDGLIGSDYLDRYCYTMDFDGGRMFLR